MNTVAIVVVSFVPIALSAGTPLEPIGFIATAAGLWLGVRAARMSVRLDDDACTVKNLFRSHRIELGEIDRFSFDLNPSTLYRNESMVLVRKTGRAIPITVLTLPAFSSMQGAGRERCSRMNEELSRRNATMPPGAGTGRHRRIT